MEVHPLDAASKSTYFRKGGCGRPPPPIERIKDEIRRARSQRDALCSSPRNMDRRQILFDIRSPYRTNSYSIQAGTFHE